LNREANGQEVELIVLTADRKKRIAIFVATAALIFALYWWHRDPVPHRNQSPHRWMTVTADATDLPDQIDKGNASVSYEIDNVDCLKPMIVSGAHRRGFYKEDIVPTRVSANRLQARIALDLFQDEDYEGLGACRWRLSTVVFTLEGREHQFNAAVAGPVIEEIRSRTTYYSASSITEARGARPVEGFGMPSALNLAPEEKVYRATLSAKEAPHAAIRPHAP
jgi:hypothetical protein